MKRNLILGIALIGAAALSSCSTTKIAAIKSSAFDDDVYYTRAKAGDSQSFVAGNQMNYNSDDDYYYYGDYASRLARFSSSSPFSYTDNFYYSYVPYNNGFGAGTAYDRDYYAYNYGFGSQPNNGFLSNYVYSPYDYGYDPYSFGYDDFGYGDIYSAYLFGGYDLGYGGGGGYSYYGGGGYSNRHHNSNVIVAGNNPTARGARTGGSPGITRISTLPGRPVVSVNPTTGRITRINTNSINTSNNNSQNNNVNRQTQANRPQTFSNTTTSSSSSSSGGGGSAGAGGGGGGGGRPGRP